MIIIYLWKFACKNILNEFITNRPDLFNVQVAQSFVKTEHKALIINSNADCVQAIRGLNAQRLKCVIIHRSHRACCDRSLQTIIGAA